MDRLIALLALRFRLDVRALVGSRSRLVALLVTLPSLGMLSLAAALLAASAARLLERSSPELTLPLLSAASAFLGLLWALSPLLAGLQATETHDLGRLLHYPVPLPTLVASSLLANLAQPLVLAQVPPVLALAFGLAGVSLRWPLAAAGLLLWLGLVLAAGQAVGLGLHALSRHRRWSDRALLAGIAASLSLSLLPILVLSGGTRATRLVRAAAESDAVAFVPFTWGVRAAVHAGRGETLGFLVFAAAAAAAVVAAVAVSVAIARRMYRGELDLGAGSAAGTAPARSPLPGRIGALVEKDLRVTWRDPRSKAVFFAGTIGPLLVAALLWQGVAGEDAPGILLGLATFVGLGVLGANAFAAERQGLALLFSFPVERVRLLVAKNATSIALRLPALAALALATLAVAGPALVPAVLSLVLLTQVLACSVDNYASILAPVPVPRAGADPSAPISGVRGLGAATVGMASILATLALSAPFAFLVWLPHLLGTPALWALSLPVALAGAGGAYYLLAALAARVLSGREPELVARAAGDE